MDSIAPENNNIFRLLRFCAGLSRQTVVNETGLDMHDLARAEDGAGSFSLRKYMILAKFYGVSPDVLIRNDCAAAFNRLPDEEARRRTLESNAYQANQKKISGDIGEKLSYEYERARHLRPAATPLFHAIRFLKRRFTPASPAPRVCGRRPCRSEHCGSRDTGRSSCRAAGHSIPSADDCSAFQTVSAVSSALPLSARPAAAGPFLTIVLQTSVWACHVAPVLIF